jgi:GNAT superfamily N-acetyltransferase
MSSVFPIRLATTEDLDAIHQWLKEEDATGKHGCFLCNFNLLERGQGAGRLTVLTELDGRQPIAFCLSGDCSLDILAVKADRRGYGYGRQLAQHCIDEAKRRGNPGLLVLCKPTSSIGFWLKMGFKKVDLSDREHCHAAITFSRRRSDFRDTDGGLSDLRIDYQSSPRNQTEFCSFRTRVAHRDANRYILEESFSALIEDCNTIIRVVLDDRIISNRELKYSYDLGFVQNDPFVTMETFAAP